MRKLQAVAAALSMLAPTIAQAGKQTVLLPVQVGDETARFRPGSTTVQLQRPEGVVEVTPLRDDHGSYAFTVAILNTGLAPVNISPGDVNGRVGAQTLPVFTVNQLAKKAKNRAMWSQIGLAALGGLAAAAASSQRDYYHSTYRTPRGTYHYSFSAPSTAGQIQAAAITAGTVYGVSRIQDQLEQTRAAIGDSTLQQTTIDPGDSYAARVVLAKVKSKGPYDRLLLTVHWAGVDYPFAFTSWKAGIPAPVMKLTPEPAPSPMRVVFDPPAPLPVQPLPSAMSVADEIGKLAALRDRGALTDGEFQAAKAAVLVKPQ